MNIYIGNLGFDATENDVEVAISGIDQKSICGRDDTVNEAKPREERSGGGRW